VVTAADNEKLVEVDRLLNSFTAEQRVGDKNAKGAESLLIKLSEAILSSQGIEPNIWNRSPFDALFDRTFAESTQRFIAICLLRLFAYDSSCLQDTNRKHKVFAIFDKEISGDVYPELKIKADQQTYEKESKLRDVAIRVESKWATVISSFTSLSVLDSFRSECMGQVLILL